jgi:class 3 adenylate cyclase/tetratricopeptide (TPR) repeat protein
MLNVCSACGSPNDAARKFCGTCGVRLARTCPSCGTANGAYDRFCGECGATLPDTGGPDERTVASQPPADRPAPWAERRLVSVLFADLVGFTGLAEDRDPEAVRDLLTRYFALATDVIGRYGGTVEKFIGDAVMAVWGAPVAREDDPERAVRAALELLDGVHQLGFDAAGSPLRARAGVLTGDAAVTIGSTNQGMVAGDLVNTASRLQAVAPPDAVLVGEATHLATENAIAYEPVGEQSLKGKALPVPAWRAERVLAKVGGIGRSEGLEPPFVGRDEELRLIKDLLHAAERDRRLRFVSITGQPGTGKSRITWELNKYVDGLASDVYWHQGRSPAYGEGITFWALGEMVRRRAGLAEGDDPAVTRERIGAALRAYVPDEAERTWIEPKLLGLLGLVELRALEREELFAAWRTFFERVSDHGTTVLVFEDIHWADQGLLDFIESLAEWSTDHPFLLLTLARPELLDRYPDWGRGRRGFTALSLDPLPDRAMGELLAGIVPGLPDAARDAILSRADGIPLYAVETVRKLIVEGRLEQDGDRYRPRGDLDLSGVPETLHALIAARLDALDPAQRSLLQDASVLGQTFSPAALSAVAGIDETELEPRLRDLVRRDVLLHNRDPRSPERGQYAFVQALIREVAYGTLSRRDRRARHVAAARYFESLGEEELAGALASHYLDAYHASDPGPEADAIAVQARIALRSAAERAASLHSHEQALTYLEAALQVTTGAAERASLSELAGEAANRVSRREDAERHLGAAIEAYRQAGDRGGVARATASVGLIQTFQGRPLEGIAILEPALAETGDLGQSRDVMILQGALARSYLFADDYRQAIELADRVLVAAGKVDDLPIVTDTLITKGTTLMYMERYREGVALMTGGLDLAEKHGLVLLELRARLNISFSLSTDDPRESLRASGIGLEKARRFGFRDWALLLAGNAADTQFTLGDWDDLLAAHRALLPHAGEGDIGDLSGTVLAMRALRGESADLTDELRAYEAILQGQTGSQERGWGMLVHQWLDLAEGRLDAVLDAPIDSLPLTNSAPCRIVAGHVALWRRHADRVRVEVSALAEVTLIGDWIDVQRATLEAGLAALEGRTRDSEQGYADALAGLLELGAWRDVAILHIGHAAVAEDDAVAAKAALDGRDVADRLGAVALRARLEEVMGRRGSPDGTQPIAGPVAESSVLDPA